MGGGVEGLGMREGREERRINLNKGEEKESEDGERGGQEVRDGACVCVCHAGE